MCAYKLARLTDPSNSLGVLSKWHCSKTTSRVTLTVTLENGRWEPHGPALWEASGDPTPRGFWEAGPAGAGRPPVWWRDQPPSGPNPGTRSFQLHGLLHRPQPRPPPQKRSGQVLLPCPGLPHLPPQHTYRHPEFPEAEPKPGPDSPPGLPWMSLSCELTVSNFRSGEAAHRPILSTF